MKKILVFVAAGMLSMGFMSCNDSAASSSDAMDSLSMVFGDLAGADMKQRISMDSTIDINELLKGIEYMANADTSKSFQAGLQMGMQVAQLYQGINMQCGMPMNKALFMKHLTDALNAKTPMSQEDMAAIQSKIEPLIDKAIEQSPMAKENKAKGEEYMKKLKNDKSYTFTKSGIAYKVVNPGEGKNFCDSDVVKVIYVGKHIDGTEFDNSKGEPRPMNLKQVVPGFAEILQLMKPGSKFEVVIPSDLAYGKQGRMPNIKANETLLFEIETVGIQDPNEQPAMPQMPQVHMK